MRSSERPSGRTINTSDMRVKHQPGKTNPCKLIERNYCRECTRRKRGDSWELDYCRWFKKPCKDARMGGQLPILYCKGFGEINKN